MRYAMPFMHFDAIFFFPVAFIAAACHARLSRLLIFVTFSSLLLFTPWRCFFSLFSLMPCRFFHAFFLFADDFLRYFRCH